MIDRRLDVEPHLSGLLMGLRQQTDMDLTVPGFQGQLEPHQKVAVAFGALSQWCLWVLATGLGKTVATIALDRLLRSLGRVRKTLVLVQSAKRFDWTAEFRRFADLDPVMVDGPKGKRAQQWYGAQNFDSVTIASYESQRDDMLERQLLPDGQQVYYSTTQLATACKYDLVVFDEVSLFKTWGTVLHQALVDLIVRTNPTYTVGLSATPIQKSGDDIYSVLDKVRPGYLGNRDWFRRTFLTFRDYGKQTERVTGLQNAPQLAARLAPIVFVREKHEVYKDKLVHKSKLCRVELTPEQLRQYNEVASSATPGMERAELLQRFAKLEKIVDTARWLNPESRASAKIDDFAQRLDRDFADEKVLVFSKTLLPLGEVEDLVLKPREIDYIRFTGKEHNQRLRDESRHRFLEDPACRVALVSGAAEMGFDFQSARTLFFLNHIPNPQRMVQVIGRIDRPVVQTGYILTLHYIAIGTFEESLIPKLHREAELSKSLLGTSNRFDELKTDLIEALSNENLFDLIRNGRVPDHV